MAKATLIGYPRIGLHRELKVAVEAYWAGGIPADELSRVAADIRLKNLQTQEACGLDHFVSNDFSLYDHVLDMSSLFGVVPSRYGWSGGGVDMYTYFAMARGVQQSGYDVAACDMTKWFDTNYHFIVPEFERGQKFKLSSDKPIREYVEARDKGFETRPALLGPITFLLLGKNPGGDDALDHLIPLLEAYGDLLARLEEAGTAWVQFDEPIFVTDLDDRMRQAAVRAYKHLRDASGMKILVTTPYGRLDDNLQTVINLPIDALLIDLVRGEGQLDAVLAATPPSLTLCLGVVCGRNVWRNDLEASLSLLEKAADKVGKERIWVSPSCSLLHVPYDLDEEKKLDRNVKSWLAFAKQKLEETSLLAKGLNFGRQAIAEGLSLSVQAAESRRASTLIHDRSVQERLAEQPLSQAGRSSPFPKRREAQKQKLGLPLFPTTTIGSFPQTAEVRKERAAYRAGKLSHEAYDAFIREKIASCINFQEKAGFDVLVHGEFERNDMVEFFGERLRGFAFTENGWVQSYGSRGVKPPIIYGDVFRPEAMTVALSKYAQSLTQKPVKGMLTGPVTILQWSFVRNDQHPSVTAHQIALALQDEVLELEAEGIGIIQIDEPAFREGLPLRKAQQKAYFDWAIQAFRMASTGVKDETQIHTHMCYSDFNNIVEQIKALDADVISIETSRSQMELLNAFVDFKYPNEIGPGVYDIHSPRVPSEDEIVHLLEKACERLEPWQIWVNPDCGLKTRDWPETRLSLSRLIVAAKSFRARYTG